MDAETLQAIRARCEAATPGPWIASEVEPRGLSSVTAVGDNWGVFTKIGERKPRQYATPEADAAFIAHARTDIPALLDEVARLRAALECILQRSGLDELPYDAISPGMLIVGKIAKGTLEPQDA